MQFKRNISQVYLTLVPFIAAIFGLLVGYISYRIYLPIWIANVCLMMISVRTLVTPGFKNQTLEKKQLIAGALFLILPFFLISMFFGLGAPPYNKPLEWVASATEQQVRYFFLLTAGVSVAFGFALLKEKLKSTAGGIYAMIGFVAIQIAIPIFLINMTFWGYYLSKLYSIMAETGSIKTYDWALPMASQFHFVNIIVCELVYLATALFAVSFRIAGWFKPIASNVYLLISIVALLINIIPTNSPEPFSTINYIISIPAIPFIMPYLMAINIIKNE
jgi:xanthosine utilization system XapX-like protein